ncbi:cell division protein FtsW [Rhodococcus sp. 27YEA15]|uniref:putative lipid II flippase FtsW n=1 Tax=Rhodococcus sp. 27YEA15 TaxID=3156259 RepID=UPI003C7A00D4
MVIGRRGGQSDDRGRKKSNGSPRASAAGRGQGQGGFRGRVASWSDRPLFDFHLLVGLVVLIVAFGLLMVLSSSGVESYVFAGTSYARFWPQCMFAALGLLLFVAVVRVPTTMLSKYSPWLVIVCVALLVLVLVPGIGSSQMGAQSWFVVGGMSFQPSELAKLALVIWSASTIALFVNSRLDVNRALPVIGLTTLVILVLVVAEKDLGTTVTIGILFMAVLWFGLFKMRTFITLAIGSGVAFVILGLTAGYRSDRIRAFLNPDLDPQGINFQSTQAKYALANGGIFGQGLGRSDAKWSYLPQAHNDFIFAVIGEELGLVGALAVVGLFAAVLIVGLRIATRSVDPFLRTMTATATTMIVVQAVINIAYVVGLIPVTGLQLPLISAGGTSMITTLLMFGLIAHAAYREPAAVASFESARNGWTRRVFGRPRFGAPRKAAVADRDRDRRPPGRTRERAGHTSAPTRVTRSQQVPRRGRARDVPATARRRSGINRSRRAS